MSDWARLKQLAAQAASKYRWSEDHADLEQAALFAAWRCEQASDRNVVAAAKLAVIDEYRRLNGRHAHTRDARRCLPLEDVHTTEDRLRPSIELGLSGREAFLVDELAEGHRPQDLAFVLGVSPSMVTKVARRVGDKVGR